MGALFEDYSQTVVRMEFEPQTRRYGRIGFICRNGRGVRVAVSSEVQQIERASLSVTHLTDYPNRQLSPPPMPRAKESTAPKRKSADIGDPKPPKKTQAMSIEDITMQKSGAAIHGRIRSKNQIREFQKADGQGRVFSFVMGDGTADITVVCYDNLATTFYEKIETGLCYRVTRYKTKARHLQYNKQTSHECELELMKVSTVNPRHDPTVSTYFHLLLCVSKLSFFQVSAIEKIDEEGLPEIAFNNVLLAELLWIKPNLNVDIAVVAFEVLPPQQMNCSDHIVRRLQNVRLVDDSQKIVTLALWEQFIGHLDDKEGHVAFIGQVETRDFGGRRTLTSTRATSLSFDSEALTDTKERLLQWWATEAENQQNEELFLVNPAAE